MEYPAIRKALLELDDTKLSFDDLKAISRQVPTPEEVNYLIRVISSLYHLLRITGRTNQDF